MTSSGLSSLRRISSSSGSSSSSDGIANWYFTHSRPKISLKNAAKRCTPESSGRQSASEVISLDCFAFVACAASSSWIDSPEAKTIWNSVRLRSAHARNAAEAATTCADGSSAAWSSRATVIAATTSSKIERRHEGEQVGVAVDVAVERRGSEPHLLGDRPDGDVVALAQQPARDVDDLVERRLPLPLAPRRNRRHASCLSSVVREGEPRVDVTQS